MFHVSYTCKYDENRSLQHIISLDRYPVILINDHTVIHATYYMSLLVIFNNGDFNIYAYIYFVIPNQHS